MDIKVPLVLFPVIELHATYVATGSVVCILPTPTLKQLLPRANFGHVPKKRKLTSKAQSKQPNFVLRLSAKCWLSCAIRRRKTETLLPIRWAFKWHNLWTESRCDFFTKLSWILIILTHSSLFFSENTNFSLVRRRLTVKTWLRSNFALLIFAFSSFSSSSDFRQSIIVSRAMCALDLYRFRLSLVQHVSDGLGSVRRVSISSSSSAWYVKAAHEKFSFVLRVRGKVACWVE